MKFLFVSVLGFLLVSYHVTAQPKSVPTKISLGHPADSRIHIGLQLGKNYPEDSTDFSFLNQEGRLEGWKTYKLKVDSGIADWQADTYKPMLVNLDLPNFKKLKEKFKFKVGCFVEPGSDVKVLYDGTRLEFTGKGSENFRLQYTIDSATALLKMPKNVIPYVIVSAEDFFEWNNYLRERTEIALNAIESHKTELTPKAYEYIKYLNLRMIHGARCNKFHELVTHSRQLGVSKPELCRIYDSTMDTGPLKWFRNFPYGESMVDNIRLQVARKYGFAWDSTMDIKNLNFLYFEEGKKTYRGNTREEFYIDLLKLVALRKSRFTPENEALLKAYYAEPGYPEYKKYVKEIEMKARVITVGKLAPKFSLTDAEGRTLQDEQLKGKIVLMDFWFTGCAGCVQMAPAIGKIEEMFKNDTNVVFLSINTDGDKKKWLKSVSEKKYTSGGGINVYTDGQATKHPMISDYNISAYPSLILIDINGRIAANPAPDPRSSAGARNLVKQIEKELAFVHDGPYVIEQDQKRMAYSINNGSVARTEINKDKAARLTVYTDEYNKTFNVTLKQSLETEPSEFEKPEKMFVLSDIEGNFPALRKLLQSNKVIDKDFNWTFGKGHMVFIGDMFDRGDQVTECLWLIYSLEEKAKAAGGYVHFILGNHEIMNLSGDNDYTKPKYPYNAQLLGTSYSNLYGRNTELGKWLRTKNIIEKVGDILFVHGGLCKEVVDLPVSLSEMNRIARPFYDNDSLASRSDDKTLALLYNTKDKLSPFWYRDYYLIEGSKVIIHATRPTDTVYRTSAETIDMTLNKFGVRHIATGHTIVPKQQGVNVHYDGKVINTDTWHVKEGYSSALLIEDGKFYKVSDTGVKELLDMAHKQKNDPVVKTISYTN